MRVIIPVTPTLVSSTVPEPDSGESVYSTGTTYAAGAQVISTTSHKIFESLQAANLNKPLPVAPETATAWWEEIGSTNRWASLDLYRNTRSTGTSPMVITISPGERINSIAVMGMDAETVTIEMVNDSVTVYSASFDLNLRTAINAYEYCFKPFKLQQSVVAFDLPPFYAGTVTVTLTKGSGDVGVGAIVPGTYVYLGATQQNPSSDSRNFSTVERDLYGTATLVPRRTLPQTRQTLFGESAIVNDLIATRVALNAAPAVWSGLDDSDTNDYFEALLILGVYTRFAINLSHTTRVETALDLEEI